MATKSFGKRKTVKRGPITFQIHEEEFRVRGHMSGLRILNLLSSMDSSRENDSAQEMKKFLERAFIDEDREKGMDYLANSEEPVELSDLVEIITWLISEYSGNASSPSEPSTDGSSTTGTGSTGMPGSPESISTTNGSMPLITSPS